MIHQQESYTDTAAYLSFLKREILVNVSLFSMRDFKVIQMIRISLN
jgi:hypothetical protein